MPAPEVGLSESSLIRMLLWEFPPLTIPKSSHNRTRRDRWYHALALAWVYSSRRVSRIVSGKIEKGSSDHLATRS